MGQPSPQTSVPVGKATLSPPIIPHVVENGADEDDEERLMAPSPPPLSSPSPDDEPMAPSPSLSRLGRRSAPLPDHDGGPDDGGDDDGTADLDASDSVHSPSDGDDELSPHVGAHEPPRVGALPPPASLSLGGSDEIVDQLGDENLTQEGSLHIGPPRPEGSPDCEVTGANLSSASAAAVAAAAAAAPPAAAAQVEPDDPTVPRWDRSVFAFGPFFHEVVRAGNQSTMLQLPNFPLLGYEWHLDLYPLRLGGTVGAFLRYIGRSPGNNSWELPSVRFRIVAFHRDVVAETERLNAPILEQRKQAALRAAEAAAEASGVPSPPSAAALQAAAEMFPLHSYPTNDLRNAESVQMHPYRFTLGEDYGFKNWIDHDDIKNFLCGPRQTLHFRVLMEGERRVEAAGGRIRKLSSFLTDAAADLNGPQLQWPYLGLNNQGATCYLSSYVQTLFYLPEFRRAVYNIPVDAQQMLELIEPGGSAAAAAAAGGSSLGLAARSPSPVAVKTSIPLALQHLFFLLQTGRKAVDTRTLTKSFGWDSADSFQQHDVQEFSRVLLDALDESVAKQQPPMSAITRLFEGKQQMFIECANVPYASARVESFLDLALNVKGAQTLQRSFDEYVAEELMTGSNQYRAVDKEKGVDFGMQDARKGVRFLRFPKVLQIQLKRFEYTEMGTMRKLDERLEFPARLDLTKMEWGEEEEAEATAADAELDPAAPKKPRARKPTDPLDPAIYHLHSVLVHRGSLSGGHYFAYIRPFLGAAGAGYEDSPWLKFDDETVSICADAREATEKNFGGEYVDVFQCLGKKMTESARSNGNAYMLVYIRQKLVAAKGFSEDAAGEAAAAAVEETKQEDQPAAAANGIHPNSSAAAALLAKGEPAPMPHLNGESKESEANGIVNADGDGDASMEPGAPAPPKLTRAPSHCFTTTPSDLRSFIESLAPVPVPLPPHISTGIDEARRVRREREEREKELATQFKLEVVVESDVVWQGLGSGAGRGGVAGLDLTVAPALDAADPQPLALRDFLFSAPHKEHTFKRMDTIGAVRAKLAEEAGLPLERAQLWRVHRKAAATAAGLALRRHQCDYLHDDNKLLSSLTDSPLMAAQGSPLLLVRDRLAVDQDESLSKIAANAGKIDGAHRSLDPSASGGAGQNERILLFFKYFDVHSQRLVTVGSAILWKHMSVQHLKQFLTALLQSRGIDLGSRCRLPAATTVERFEQLRPASIASATAAIKEEAADSDMTPAGASSTLPFLAHMHRLGASAPSFAGAAAAPTPTDEVVEVHDVSSKSALSFDEQRCARWFQDRLAGVAAAPVTPASFTAPMLHLVEEAECVATAMREAAEGAPAAAAAAANLLKIKDAAMAIIERLQNNASTLRECGLINGSVLVVEPQLSAREFSHASSAFSKQFLRIHRADGAKSAPSTPTSSDSPRKQLPSADLPMAASSSSAASAADSAAGSAGSVSPSTSVAALRDPLADTTIFTSPLRSALLDSLPVHASFHPNARSYLNYLLHRWLVEFQPAVLDPVTMERAPLDPATSPLHPAAALGSVVVEVSTAWTLDHMRSQLAQRVSALVSPAIRASYPQVSNAHCYKLWKPSRQFPGTVYVKDGDVTRKMLNGSPLSVAHSLVATTTVDGLGPLEQLVRSRSTRAAVQSLFFELSAVSLRELEDSWWLQLELVDERGEVRRLPSLYPGLCVDQPFLAPKRTDFLLGHLRQLIFDQFIVAHRTSFPLAHYALLGVDGLPLLPAVAPADAAMIDSAQSEPPTSASKRRAEANGSVDQPAAKKLKNEDAQAVSTSASAVGGDAMVAASSVAAPSVSLGVDDLRLHVYVPNAPPVVMNFTAPPAPMAHFLLPWSNWFKCSVSKAATEQLRFFFDRARVATPKGSHIRHPAMFSDKDLNAAQYTQPLPFRLTCHLQPTPAKHDALIEAWVYRFTAFASSDAPLPQRQGYSFSPLPPILAYADRDGDVRAFRQRFAQQLDKKPEELQLALLRPKQYELMPTDAAAASDAAAAAVSVASLSPTSPSLFDEWKGDDDRVQLGLFDPLSKHQLNTSSSQIDTAAGSSLNNATRFHNKNAAVSIRK